MRNDMINASINLHTRVHQIVLGTSKNSFQRVQKMHLFLPGSVEIMYSKYLISQKFDRNTG